MLTPSLRNLAFSPHPFDQPTASRDDFLRILSHRFLRLRLRSFSSLVQTKFQLTRSKLFPVILNPTYILNETKMTKRQIIERTSRRSIEYNDRENVERKESDSNSLLKSNLSLSIFSSLDTFDSEFNNHFESKDKTTNYPSLFYRFRNLRRKNNSIRTRSRRHPRLFRRNVFHRIGRDKHSTGDDLN